MKTILFIIVSIIYISVCYAQTDTYNYKLNYQLIHTDKNNNELYRETLLLLYGNKKSMFISQNKIVLDSLRTLFKEKNDIYGFLDYRRSHNLKTFFTPIIIKNHQTNKYTFQDEEMITTYKYTGKQSNFHWVIIKDKTKKVLGYNCKLATTNYKGRKYKAWFTNEIPISDGPYKFTGLPGLIVNIYDTKKQYNFTLTGIRKIKGNFPKIKTKKVIEIKENQLKNVIEGAKQEILNIMIGDSKEKLKKVFNAKKKNANPIELDDN